MVKPTRPTNPYLKQLIEKLRKISIEKNVKIWRRIAELLERPRRKRVEVNLSKIERYSKANEFVVVPGKVLGAGNLTKPINIAAWRFSEKAKEKILKVNGKCLTIEELIENNPKGSKVKIIS
jgi:large subunit ribosomal protein L18e